MKNSSAASQQICQSKPVSAFSCFVVGEGAIAVRCLQLLSQAGQTILGVYSADSLVKIWAEEQGIPQSFSQSSFQNLLRGTQYDYLFSINNAWIIPEVVIQQAVKATINYHDSPLPRYAGTHATSWALIDGETQHAITWHQVTPKIDAGDILKQVPVPIHADDTALSLNIRCLETAIAAFDQLIRELSENQETRFAQNLSHRSYFSASQRPEAACVLSFQQSTKELYNLVRALDFGCISNLLGLPKLWLPDGIVCVRSAKIVEAHLGLPGQILVVDEHGVQIAASDGTLLLSQMTTLEGVPLSTTDLIEDFGVQVERVLPCFSPEQRQIISHHHQSICRHERFWVDRLVERVPFIHPYIQNEALTQKVAREVQRYQIEWSSSHDRYDTDDLTLLTLFAAYCARLSTEAEFDLGLQTSTQRSVAPELFAQSVPLRIHCQEGESFAQFSARMKVELQRVSQRGNYARDIVARYPELQVDSVSPLSVALVLASCPDDLNVDSLNSAIVLIAYESGSPPELIHTGALNQQQTEAILRQLHCFIRGCLQYPEQCLHSLPILTDTESYRLVFEWNQTQSDYPDEKCIHSLFEEQVKRTPDAIAVVFENQQLTYYQLNQRANQLAYYLQDLGVKAETLVGICVERSLYTIIGILGILKAGGAYVPLDPAYPQERLSLIIEDANVSLVLTKSKLIDRLPIHQIRPVYLDKEWQEIFQQSGENLTQSVKYSNLAYVIYTSGSTGKPKGVLVEHKSLVNYTLAAIAKYNINSRDRILQFTSLNFDVSAEEIYTCLITGASLVLRTESMLASSQIFLQKCQEWGITIAILPAAYWHNLTTRLESDRLSLPPALKLVVVGGECVLANKVEQWQEYVGKQVRLINAYGPTEATISALWCDLSELNLTVPLSEVPIGRPIANTQVYILDNHLQPVPIGVAGELYIGGDGLARGYLNRPDLTAEKFIPNSFSNQRNARLYKTGDLARYLPDGNIEFLGRIDHQVKIRGFRIELGEIESALTQHPHVGEVVVVVREDKPGDKRLVAYITGNLTSDSIPSIRNYLKGKLPDYMMPSAIVLLDMMPLTPNGKIDRRALPVPDLRPELELTFAAPRTPTEEIVANIWSEVLSIMPIGIHDNFFELGGHSLLSIQIISRLRESFAIDLPISLLFASPTIAEFCQAIETQIADRPSERAITQAAIVPVPRTTAIPLSFSQSDLWYKEQHHSGDRAANSPLTLRIRGSLSPAILEKAINEIISRHEILRTTFPTLEGKPIQHIFPVLTAPLEVINLQSLPATKREIEAEKTLIKAMNHSFNLATAPLIKTVLVQISNEEYWLLILMHHIIIDGWSYDVFMYELETLYADFLANRLSSLPELPFQYADFTIWQYNYVQSEAVSAHLNYWQKHLANLPIPLDLLPAIQPEVDGKCLSANYHLCLPEHLTSELKLFSIVNNITPSTILLATLKILLSQWSQQSDILIVNTIANRNTSEVERLLGCFMSDFLIRCQVKSDETGTVLLNKVNHAVSEGMIYALPGEKIWELFAEERKTLRTVLLSMVPAIKCSSQTFKSEELIIHSERGLWDDSHLPLELYISYPTETDLAIELYADYSTTTFTAETIDLFLTRYQAILERLVRHPETLISEFAKK
jgi:amino acid adenylation domain-containing protein